MSATMALIGFTAWTLLLVILVVGWRAVEVLRGRPANSWGRGSAIASPSFVTRAEHAHINSLENLPIFAAIVLAGSLLGKTAAIDTVAAWVLYARIAQSVTHLIGTSPALVLVRATFFGIQIALFVWLLWRLVS